MSEPSTILERECAVFTRFLTGLDPSGYVRTRYVAAHAVRPHFAETTPRETRLVALAAAGRFWCRLADAYAALFEPQGLLRRKLVMLLAVLETCPPYFEVLDRPLRGGWPGALLGLTLRGIRAVAVGAAAVAVVPVARALQRPKGP